MRRNSYFFPRFSKYLILGLERVGGLYTVLFVLHWAGLEVYVFFLATLQLISTGVHISAKQPGKDLACGSQHGGELAFH